MQKNSIRELLNSNCIPFSNPSSASYKSRHSAVADNQAAAKHAVVSHVNGLHQEVIAAYYGLALRGCTTRDSNVLTDTVVIANLACCLLALELQILRLGRDAGTWEELIVVSDAGTYMDGDAVL